MSFPTILYIILGRGISTESTILQSDLAMCSTEILFKWNNCRRQTAELCCCCRCSNRIYTLLLTAISHRRAWCLVAIICSYELLLLWQPINICHRLTKQVQCVSFVSHSDCSCLSLSIGCPNWIQFVHREASLQDWLSWCLTVSLISMQGRPWMGDSIIMEDWIGSLEYRLPNNTNTTVSSERMQTRDSSSSFAIWMTCWLIISGLF